MTKKDIKSIILYLDSADAIEYLTNEQTGILFKAVFRYARTGQKLESSDTALTALFTIMCAQIDRDHKKYIPLYLASTPEIRYRKNIENFLSERYWENHPLNTIQNEGTSNTYPTLNGTERRKRDVCQSAVKAIANINFIAEAAAIPAETVVATEISDS